MLKAGQSLNDSALPPHSADGVVFDDGGPISLIFSTPVYGVGGCFTYTSGLTVAIYDDIGTSLGVLTGPYVSNLADGSGDSGSAPNEFLQLANPLGLISRITITSAANGSSVVLDDLTVDYGGVAMPAPASIVLMAGVIVAGLRRGGWLRRS